MVERGADPKLIIELAHELQKRIGILPMVKVDACSLPNESGIIYRILRIQPSSMSEISRVIRAARTMKLHIRCIGKGSSLNRTILINDFNVLLDLRFLSDSERIERVVVKLKDSFYVEGIRVLAGVTNHELCEYQIQNQICFPTNTESLERTVIGTIVSGTHGVMTNAYNSIADYVIQVRILDIHGEMKTYTDNFYLQSKESNNNIKSIISGLGMLGIVYDVVIKYDVLKTVDVSYDFLTVEKLLSNFEFLNKKINSQMCTQLIYIPYNSLSCAFRESDINMNDWSSKNDEVMIRNMEESDNDSDIRQYLVVIDEDRGHLDTVLKEPALIPLVLKESHRQMSIDFIEPTTQYLPWAIHCFPPVSNGFHEATISMSLGDLSDFKKVFQLILNNIEEKRQNHSINGGIRVNFTNGTNVTLCPGKKGQNKTIHIKLLGVMSCPGWKEMVFPIIDDILRNVPTAVLQWSSEWIDRPIVVERILELEEGNLDNLKIEIEKMDRDGVFLNDHLQRIFYPILKSYRSTYKNLQNEFLKKLP